MFDDPVLFIVVALSGFAGLIWWAKKYDGIHKRVKEQQDRAGEQLQKSQELQQRALQILDREDAMLARAEALLDRFEDKCRTFPAH